ncbi:hypothetical protein F2Q69_00017784 [Brassica cretica]|uniref:Uncharacterized protein n=3 Tax=Brassica TaxID=3705 RepID=A0A0D3C5I2_BRAOL|nr:hypothetical protein F2Q69_00017784 [Brassica cretica]VDD15835.1 unnamed protein product [Brassica oleracea]
MFPVQGSERKGLVSVEVKNKKGQMYIMSSLRLNVALQIRASYDMKLLAVDIQMVSGPDKQLFLIGDEEVLKRKKTLKENFKKVKESTVKRFKKLEKESS